MIILLDVKLLFLRYFGLRSCCWYGEVPWILNTAFPCRVRFSLGPEGKGFKGIHIPHELQKRYMYDLTNFAQEDMFKCALELRNISTSAKSMEAAARQITAYLYENLINPQTGNPDCTLVRLFKTHLYEELPAEVQKSACDLLKLSSIERGTKCLTLLGTAGDEPHWNSRERSTGHQAIPLISEEFVSGVPMIARLLQEFGLEASTVLEPMPSLLIESDRKIHSTFILHIPEALGSPYIPAQTGFVIPYGVKSVLGFGGLLSSGNLFIVILFSKVPITAETASLFKWISTYVWVAITAFDQEVIFAAA